MYYRGYYHLFYQYNTKGVAWDDGMVWGHVVSQDLVHWRHLPIAMVPDHWYDDMGVLSGSITVLHNGSLVMVYTGVFTNTTTGHMMEVQCLAVPTDPTDPPMPMPVDQAPRQPRPRSSAGDQGHGLPRSYHRLVRRLRLHVAHRHWFQG